MIYVYLSDHYSIPSEWNWQIILGRNMLNGEWHYSILWPWTYYKGIIQNEIALETKQIATQLELFQIAGIRMTINNGALAQR